MADPLAEYRSGSTEPWTVEFLCAYVRAAKPRVVLETGTFEAQTTLRLLHTLIENGLGFTLDSVESDRDRAFAAQAILEPENQQGLGRVRMVHGDAMVNFYHTPDNSVDMIFLDDDHAMPHVLDELIQAKRVLRPSGVCFVHDAVGPFNLHYVVHGMGGVVLDLPRLHAAGGLGIVTKT